MPYFLMPELSPVKEGKEIFVAVLLPLVLYDGRSILIDYGVVVFW